MSVIFCQKMISISVFCFLKVTWYDLYLEFCPNSSDDFDSPDFIDDDYEDEEAEYGDEDENVSKIMRDQPIPMMAMQPPSISMICDWTPRTSSMGSPFRNSKYKVTQSQKNHTAMAKVSEASNEESENHRDTAKSEEIQPQPLRPLQPLTLAETDL